MKIFFKGSFANSHPIMDEDEKLNGARQSRQRSRANKDRIAAYKYDDLVRKAVKQRWSVRQEKRIRKKLALNGGFDVHSDVEFTISDPIPQRPPPVLVPNQEWDEVSSSCSPSLSPSSHVSQNDWWWSKLYRRVFCASPLPFTSPSTPRTR